jgi:hypothetical protein
MGIASTIYKGSASYGRFIAIVTAIVATIIAIFLIVYGIKFNISVNKRSYNASAKVISKNCPEKTLCTYTVTYVDNMGQIIENASFESDNKIQLNSNITISYDPNNKTDIIQESENKTSTGYGYMFIALIILLFAWGWVWVTRKYEFAASSSGFSSVFDFFK